MAVNQIINGNFQDIDGNPLSNGYLLIQLNQDCTDSAGATLFCAGYTIKVLLDSGGNIPNAPESFLQVNRDLLPPTNFYYITAYSAQGKLVWGPWPQIVPSTPNPFDVGTWVPGDI